MKILIRYRNWGNIDGEHCIYFTHPHNVEHSMTLKDDAFHYSMFDELDDIYEYRVPDFTVLQEEEIFQLLTVWEHRISLDFMMKLQEVLKDHKQRNVQDYEAQVQLQ